MPRRNSNRSNIEANKSSAKAARRFEETMGRKNLPLHLALSRGELGKIQSSGLTFDFHNPAHILLFALLVSTVFVNPVSASKSPQWEEGVDEDGYPIDPEDSQSIQGAEPFNKETAGAKIANITDDYLDLTAEAFMEEDLGRDYVSIAEKFLFDPLGALQFLSESLLGVQDLPPLPETHGKKKEADPVSSSVTQKARGKKSAAIGATAKAVPLKYNIYGPRQLEDIIAESMRLVRSQSPLMQSVFEKFKPNITLEAPEKMSRQEIAKLLKSALSQYCSEFVELFKDNVYPDNVEMALIHRTATTPSPLPIDAYYRSKTVLPYAIGKDGEAVFSLGQIAKAITLSYFKANGKFPSPQDVKSIVSKGCDSRDFYRQLAECVSTIVAKEVRGEPAREIYDICARTIAKYLDGTSPHVSLSTSFVANIEEKKAIEEPLKGIVNADKIKSSEGLFQISFKIPENMSPLQLQRISGMYKLYLTSLLVTESNGHSNVEEQLDLLTRKYPGVEAVIGDQQDFLNHLRAFNDFFALTRSRIFTSDACRTIGRDPSDFDPELREVLHNILYILDPHATALPSSSVESKVGKIESVPIKGLDGKGLERNA